MTVRWAQITTDPVSPGDHLTAVDDAAMGAEVSFVGRVRDHDADANARVVALEYTAHPDAEQVLQAIAERAIGGTDAIVAVSHRIGRLEVGEAAVVIAVAAAHRGEAFEVCRALIEAIKAELPVWKRQVEADGTSAWKGLGG
jgi:molybdopterin synthase catalytic subunit